MIWYMFHGQVFYNTSPVLFFASLIIVTHARKHVTERQSAAEGAFTPFFMTDVAIKYRHVRHH